MHIGVYLKNKRIQKGLTQVKLAELIQVDESTIKRIEKKANPKVNNTLEKIYHILGIPRLNNREEMMAFNKDVDDLNPIGILNEIGINNMDQLSMVLDEKLIIAQRLASEGEYMQALDIYRSFKNIFPGEFSYLGCANIYSMCNNYEKAIEYSNKVLEINPGSYEALLIKGINLGQAKKYIEAIDVLLMATQIQKTYQVYYNLAVCYQFKQDLDNAIYYYEECLEINPDFASVYLNLGICYFNQYCFEESLDAINQAIKLDPRMYEAYGRKGEHYRFFGDYVKAIIFFEKCLALDPNNRQALFGIVVSLADMGEISKAIVYLKLFFDLYLYEYIDIDKEDGKELVLVDIGYKKTRLISFEYIGDGIVEVGIDGKYMGVELTKDEGVIFLGAVMLTDETGSMYYPALGKLYESESNRVIRRIKESVELFQYFDKPIYFDTNNKIKVNIRERKKDVFIEIIFGNKYQVLGFTNEKSKGFDIFFELYKKYNQFRIHIQCNQELLIIDAIKNLSIIKE